VYGCIYEPGSDIPKLAEIMEEAVALGIIEYECLSKKRGLGKGGG